MEEAKQAVEVVEVVAVLPPATEQVAGAYKQSAAEGVTASNHWLYQKWKKC